MVRSPDHEIDSKSPGMPTEQIQITSPLSHTSQTIKL